MAFNVQHDAGDTTEVFLVTIDVNGFYLTLSDGADFDYTIEGADLDQFFHEVEEAKKKHQALKGTAEQ